MGNASFLDRIREHKTTIILTVVMIAIAVIVCALMTPKLAPSKGEYTTAITGLEGDIARASASINTLGTSLNNRMDGVEQTVQTATGEVNLISMNTTQNSNAIQTLQTWAAGAEGRITTVEAHTSPPEGYLTGNSTGNYTLHAKCSEAGNFTANVHLVYAALIYVGNTTDYDETVGAFYAGINWTLADRKYVPVVTYNSTDWGISQVWFNAGTFALAANNETTIPVLFGGLNATYEPGFAYVEIWPVLR